MTIKRTIIILALALAIVVTAAVLINSPDSRAAITPEELAELREAYPVIPFVVPPLINAVVVPFDTVVSTVENIVYAEVIIAPEDYTVTTELSADTPEGALAQKNGSLTDDTEFLRFQVKVIRDINNEMADRELTLICRYDFQQSLPSLTLGSRYVIPISSAKSDSHEGKYSFSTTAMYYVVNDEIVLSIAGDTEKHKFSGLDVDGLFRKLKTLRK